MRRIDGLLLLLTAACTTTGAEMRESAPKMSLTSTKTPDQLEECLADNLSAMGTIAVVKGEGRRTVNVGGNGSYLMTVTITERSPAMVDVRWTVPVMNSLWRDKVRACL